MSARRAEPLSLEERRDVARRYQQTRRDKTGNHYARSYRRASQRARDWVKDNHPDVWDLLLAEALEEPNGDYCKHLNAYPVGIAMQCADCGNMVGCQSITINKEDVT